ncbi:MAG: hypothetical protein RLZZ290_1434 [Pseudomonadota bacterium]|jgi:lipoprotein NlpD
MKLFFLTLALALASCAHRPPAPIESRTVQQADSPSQTSITGKAKASAAPAVTQAAVEPEQPVPAGMHRVKRGETLIGIALEYGVDWRELASWNQVTNPNRIEVGQMLTVRGPSAAPPAALVPSQQAAISSQIDVKPLAPAASPSPAASAPPVASAPVTPPIAPPPAASTPPEAPVAPPAEPATDGLSWVWPANGGVITQFSEGGSKGIAIAGAPGEAVFAAERGRVVYSGNGLRGYGNLVIVKHANDFITAYAHNRAILVKEGQSVRRGQKIAELGMSDADRPMLHFELRKGGKPIDPLGFLPSR